MNLNALNEVSFTHCRNKTQPLDIIILISDLMHINKQLQKLLSLADITFLS